MGMLFSQEDYVALYEPVIQTKGRPQYRSCEIISIGKSYDKKQVVWAFQKDSEYLSLFNHYLKKMEEKGITKEILEKYENLPPTCPDKSGQPLDFNSVFTGFIPIVAGKDLFDLSHNPSHLSLYPDVLNLKNCFEAKICKNAIYKLLQIYKSIYGYSAT